MDRFTERVTTLEDGELIRVYEAFRDYFKYEDEGYSHNLALAHMYKREMIKRGFLDESCKH